MSVSASVSFESLSSQSLPSHLAFVFSMGPAQKNYWFFFWRLSFTLWKEEVKRLVEKEKAILYIPFTEYALEGLLESSSEKFSELFLLLSLRTAYPRNIFLVLPLTPIPFLPQGGLSGKSYALAGPHEDQNGLQTVLCRNEELFKIPSALNKNVGNTWFELWSSLASFLEKKHQQAVFLAISFEICTLNQGGRQFFKDFSIQKNWILKSYKGDQDPLLSYESYLLEMCKEIFSHFSVSYHKMAVVSSLLPYHWAQEISTAQNDLYFELLWKTEQMEQFLGVTPFFDFPYRPSIFRPSLPVFPFYPIGIFYEQEGYWNLGAEGMNVPEYFKKYHRSYLAYLEKSSSFLEDQSASKIFSHVEMIFSSDHLAPISLSFFKKLWRFFLQGKKVAISIESLTEEASNWLEKVKQESPLTYLKLTSPIQQQFIFAGELGIFLLYSAKELSCQSLALQESFWKKFLKLSLLESLVELETPEGVVYRAFKTQEEYSSASNLPSSFLYFYNVSFSLKKFSFKLPAGLVLQGHKSRGIESLSSSGRGHFEIALKAQEELVLSIGEKIL